MKKITTLSVVFGMVLFSCKPSDRSWKVDSPDGSVTMQLALSDSGTLRYSVLLNGSVVMQECPMGIVRGDADLSRQLAYQSASDISLIDEPYTLKSGKQLVCRNHANEISLSFENPEGEVLGLVMRAYDDGVAFRYIFPGRTGTSVVVTEELTGFRLPPEGISWMHPYDRVSGTSPAYETYYQGPMPVGTAAPEEMNGWAFPLLFQTANTWILVSESGVDASYCGAHLGGDPQGGLYRVNLPVKDEALDRCPREPVVEMPGILPWRFILVSEDISAIVESNMTTNLTKENRLADTTWIRPGRASWSWWSEELGARDYGVLRKYVDLAAEMGWEYSLVDAGWPNMAGGDIEQLAEYAEGKGVDLLVWYNSGGRRHTSEEAKQATMYVPEKRRKEFRRIHEMGIKGVKVDFFNSDKQCIIYQYMGILRDAADNRLVVNFHGCTLPRGWRRTFPNLMTMEAVNGQEAYRYNSSYPEESPAHQVISVFTRNVVGPMDFTPVGISDRRYPHLTSHAFELAQAVVYESGITHICDSPESYHALPDYAVDYLKRVPVAWDETRFVDGYPGEHVIMGRRKGDTWYVGCINGEKEAKEITFSLSFLERDAVMEVIVDGSGPELLDYQEYEIGHGQELTISVLPFGGFIGIID